MKKPFKDVAPHIPRTAKNHSERRKYAIRKRFYELYEVQQLRFDLVIETLAHDEFFLQEKTISEMVRYVGSYRRDKREEFGKPART